LFFSCVGRENRLAFCVMRCGGGGGGGDLSCEKVSDVCWKI